MGSVLEEAIRTNGNGVSDRVKMGVAFSPLIDLSLMKLVGTSGEIHIWCANLDQPKSLLSKLAEFLTEDEEERANRYRFELDKKRFIARRAILRTILSRYLSLEPRCVQFEYGIHGKPSVKVQSAADELRFSASHSRSVALYAVTSNREVGIDVEYLRPVPDADKIVERYFTARESAVYRSLARSQKQEAFLNAWTRKEAYVKAIGVGLSQPLNTSEISLAPDEAPSLLMIEGDSQRAASWSLYVVKPKRGYVATLAVEGSGYRLREGEWAYDQLFGRTGGGKLSSATSLYSNLIN